eukprot:3436605-Alexandrium_andersonii.AAC.1
MLVRLPDEVITHAKPIEVRVWADAKAWIRRVKPGDVAVLLGACVRKTEDSPMFPEAESRVHIEMDGMHGQGITRLDRTGMCDFPYGSPARLEHGMP